MYPYAKCAAMCHTCKWYTWNYVCWSCIIGLISCVDVGNLLVSSVVLYKFCTLAHCLMYFVISNNIVAFHIIYYVYLVLCQSTLLVKCPYVKFIFFSFSFHICVSCLSSFLYLVLKSLFWIRIKHTRYCRKIQLLSAIHVCV